MIGRWAVGIPFERLRVCEKSVRVTGWIEWHSVRVDTSTHTHSPVQVQWPVVVYAPQFCLYL